MSEQNQGKTALQNNQNGWDEREIRQESGRAAKKAQEAKQEAYRLRQAAHGAADAEERQKILEQAIDKEIEAESFGKTAKYMRTGTFQGMAVGTGIGVVPGATLGTLTGMLVGGVTSAITGGLGAGIGALTGAIHGPFWNMGKLAGKGIRKVTGDLPGWEATESQKRTLEKMIGQINEQEMPEDEELQRMREEGEADDWWNGMYQSGLSYMPSMPSWMKSKKQQEQKSTNKQGDQKPRQNEKSQEQQQQQQSETHKKAPKFQPPKQGAASPFYRNTNPATQKAGHDVKRHLKEQEAMQRRAGQDMSSPAPETDGANKENGGETRPENKTAQQTRGKPRKLEVRSNTASQSAGQPKNGDRKPRKLERRS